MDGMGMIAPHRDCHAADTARERPMAQNATAMQGFDADPLVNAEFAQPLRLAQRKALPFNPVDEGRLALRQLMQVQVR